MGRGEQYKHTLSGQGIAGRWARVCEKSIKTDSRTGRSVLMVAHCAGMVDMVALPVWVGTLIAAYKFDRPWWSTPSRC